MRLLRWIPLGLLMAPALSHAATYTLDFETKLTGDPWTPYKIATMTIADNGLDSVLITLQHHANLSNPGQKLSMLWFGIDPFTSPTQSGQTPANVFNYFSIDPGGHVGIGEKYNGQFKLSQSFFPDNHNALFQGMTASFLLSGAGIDAEDFVRNTATGNAGPIYAAIHVQEIGGGGSIKVGAANYTLTDGGDSTPVPEPASLAMIGFVSAGVAAARRKKLKATS